MTNSVVNSASRTIRPESSSLTVRGIVALPEVASGRPEIVAGASGLDRSVRWIHVLETEAVGQFVSGQELVLSTGRGWPADIELGEYIGSLAAADVAGLVIELGTRFSSVPAALLKACDRHGLPLIALHVPTKFVAITEAVHRHILAHHLEALRTRDRIHARFADMVRNGAPNEHIVQEASGLLGTSLVLEDLSHRMVTFASAGASDEEALQDWRPRSRLAHEQGNNKRLAVPVEARQRRWGYLVTLEGDVLPDEADLILGQAALALSLELLASQTPDPWSRVSHSRLLGILLERRLCSWVDVRHRLEASGFSTENRLFAGLCIRLDASAGRSSEGEIEELRSALMESANSVGADLICAKAPYASPAVMAALSVRSTTPDMDGLINEIVARCRGRTGVHVVTAGFAGGDVSALAHSLDEAMHLMNVGVSAGSSPTAIIRRTSRAELPLLLHNLYSDPRSQSFVERTLGPLLIHDAQHGTDLLKVLAAYLEYPGNRTLAASKSHLSRSVFYQRLAVIENRLGHALDDGAMVATLYAALLIYRQSAST
jgi:purine catabolism regulator